MNLATSPQNECENRRRRPSRGLAHTPGTPIFALCRWTSERAASIRGPDGGSGLFGLVLLRLPQSVTADVELQDDAVMYKSVDGQSSSSNLAKQSIVEARGRLIA